MKLDGVSAIALVLIASFAIDRLVTGVMFVITFAGLLPDPAMQESASARISADRKYKLIYYLLAGVLGIFALAHYGHLRLLSALMPTVDPLVDTVVTGLALMGGADRLAEYMKIGAPESAKQTPPAVQVTGKLTLEEGPGKKALGQGA